MAAILLADYTRPVRYTFDPVGGGVTGTRFKSRDEAAQNTAGFGTWRQVGLVRNRHKLFVAQYTDGKRLLMQIGDRLFDWADPTLRVTRAAIGPLAKRFAVFRDDTEILHLDYLFVDWQVWPDNGDIFSYMERTPRTPGDILWTIFYWTARAQGRDVATREFLAELDQRVRAALHQP